jgi:hypothetical protein
MSRVTAAGADAVGPITAGTGLMMIAKTGTGLMMIAKTGTGLMMIAKTEIAHMRMEKIRTMEEIDHMTIGIDHMTTVTDHSTKGTVMREMGLTTRETIGMRGKEAAEAEETSVKSTRIGSRKHLDVRRQ